MYGKREGKRRFAFNISR
ncbi:Protein of unknown function [Bacillus wiedmannii]|nr:Protein of unknown function [Bacillus wiedmannii]